MSWEEAVSFLGAHCVSYEDIRRKLSQLVADHVLRYCDIVVLLSVVDLEFEANKIRQDGRRARLCPDWGLFFAGLRSRNGKTWNCLVEM